VADAVGWRVVIEVDAVDAELVADRLFGFGAIGIEEQAGAAGRVLLLAGMTDEPSATRAAAELGAARVEAIVDDSWADEWRVWAQPVRVGDVLVQPSWLPVSDATARVVIAIDPGRAFGTGAHATTRLALAELLARVRGGRVLDVGCGGGVLTVAAAVAGDASVVAIDIDPNALVATQHNAARNGVASRVTVSDAPLTAIEGTFDVVVANILAVTLRELAADLARVVAPGGALVTSGMLATQVRDVDAAFAVHGLHPVAERAEGEWRCRTYEPEVGIEPTTFRLQGGRSAN
jgi:ribosomal protein L11 methyltransferase